MPLLHVSVYQFAASAPPVSLPIPLVPALAEWQIEITPESIQSPHFPLNTNWIMLMPETDCHIAFGTEPTAVPGKQPLYARERMWFGVHPTHKIAVTL